MGHGPESLKRGETSAREGWSRKPQGKKKKVDKPRRERRQVGKTAATRWDRESVHKVAARGHPNLGATGRGK